MVNGALGGVEAKDERTVTIHQINSLLIGPFFQHHCFAASLLIVLFIFHSRLMS